MEIIHSIVNIIFLVLTVLGMCLISPPYWVFKIVSFLVRSWFPEDVKDKVVLITGASSGIGEHVAYEYAKRGARLALVARRKDRLHIVAKRAKELGSPDTLIISSDISIPENCEKIVRETISRFGRVDHLVNNAGITTVRLLEEYSDIRGMNALMNINFWGAVHTTRHAMAHLRESRGKIVVISSMASWNPSPRLSLYCASKGALVSLFETLRLEVGSGVKITIATPGPIDSEMTTVSNPAANANDDTQTTNELCVKFFKKSRCPMLKVEVGAKAIVRSVCRGDRYLTEPKWVLSTYYLKLLCPDLLEFIQRSLMMDFFKKFVV